MTRDILYRLEHHTSRDGVALDIMAAAREEIALLRESNRQLTNTAARQGTLLTKIAERAVNPGIMEVSFNKDGTQVAMSSRDAYKLIEAMPCAGSDEPDWLETSDGYVEGYLSYDALAAAINKHFKVDSVPSGTVR